MEQLGDEGLLESSSEYAINYNDSYDGNSSVYTKVRKIEIQESGVTFDIEEIYEDNDGDEESCGFHEAQTIDRILESCNRDTVKRGLENILTYLNDETLIKLNKNTENESMPEPVLEPKPEPKAETKVEVEQKEEPIENGGLFSARLEAMIAAALQDGVLTDKERELLKRRVEKEGEDWDEVEMIIEARLAEMKPVASTPSSRTSENNNVSKDTTPQAIEQKKRQIEEQAKAKEVPALKVDKPISKEYVRTEEDKYATSIDIPEGVTIIPSQCFSQCSSLESITLPSTIKQIGRSAFWGCSSLTSIDIPEGVTVIPERCFCNCKKLNSVTLPTTIKKIEDYAFYECNKVKTISIPNGCERLEELGYFASSPRIFLPPSLCSIDVISTRNKLLIYCFAPQLEELEIFENCQELYVLPQYLDLYKSQAKAEEVEIDIKPMPDEYLYFYDN